NGNTIAGYVDYLDRYPRGQHVSDAQSRLESLRDTPLSRARAAEDDLSLGRDARRAVQLDLTVLGYDTNGVDGIFGAGSRRAITRWQSSIGLQQTGYLDASQIDRLRTAAAAAAPAPVAPSPSASGAGEVEAWAQARQVGTATAYTSYLQSYPNGPNAEEARARLAALQRPQSAEEQLNDLLVDGINELLKKR
ncbi:MAG: peptidoglycan-binding domain-containing protein, partial [Jannaschia sp.]